MCGMYFFFFKQKTAYEMRISDWSSDVCSSDLKGGFDADGPLFAERARGAEHLQLVVGRQAIARLDLDRRNALGDQRVEAGQGALDPLVFAGFACRAHRRHDPAAGARDPLLARPSDPPPPFVLAVAPVVALGRSEERRVGKGCVGPCRSRW